MNNKVMAAFACLVILFPLASMGEAFKMPPFPEEEFATHRTYYKEGVLDPEDMAYSQRRLHWEDPKSLKWHLYWVGEGKMREPRAELVEELYNGTTMSYKFFFKPGDKLILRGLESVARDKSGEVVRSEKHDLTHPVLEYPDNILHVNTIHYAIRGMDLSTPGTQHSIFVWLSPINPVRAEVKGTETVRLKDGREIKCYRVEVVPDLKKTMGFLLGMALELLIADYTFWFDVAGSHPLVKYEGPMGKGNTRGAPTIIYELVSEKPGAGE